ncbi:unnamed protein product [Tuber melanosporum]|uniref:(Perigord truffle) hypothetical protein n=1 Tax=Tuber melanosporum (strain Mel28) TaxID=656061 RepID=D5GK72_TUBMM|nr:uncharacterized protein GSTUM_00009405001 [Tuber melanosporum]CAZ84915.1 unnamed protein product [Tuber melanosporum]
MARPSCPKPILREKGPRCHPSTLSFPTASASNSKTQHASQLALISHTLSPLHTLLSQPIPFVKTQTISGTLAECQTVLSLGYFGREMGRKRSLASAEGKAIKRVRRKGSTNNVNSRDLGGDELLEQPQPVSERKVVGEVSVGKTTLETPARKIKLPQPGKSTIPPKDKKNKPNKELANTTSTKSKANGGATSKPVPGSQKKVIKKNGLKDVPHLPESGVPSGQSTGSTVLLPDGATAPGMTIVERDSTSKSQFKNLKLSTGSIANTSGKTVVSGTSNPDRKTEALSERYSGEYPDKQRVKGIQNRSAFCYRNSVLQLLASSEVCVQEMIGHIEMHIEESCRYPILILPVSGMSNLFKVAVVLIVFPVRLENSSRTISLLPEWIRTRTHVYH